MRNTKDIGKTGEDMAAAYLAEQGYKILCRNYRTKYGELDIVAEHKSDLVFIEVKLRTNTSFGTPELAVNKSKQNKIIKSALSYIKENNIRDKNVRFDVLSILTDKIELIKDAFSSTTFCLY
jgi:putative endonuclease